MPGPEQPTSEFIGVQTTRLIDRRWLSKSAFELELNRPQGFLFKAGQTIRLIYDKNNRFYSLASAPDDPTLQLCVTYVERGKLSPALASIELDSQLQFTGPHGFFTLSKSPRKPVFVGTDTGVAPFASMARSGCTGFTLFQGSRYPEELYYIDLFRRTAENYIPFVWGVPEIDFASSGKFENKMVDLLTQHLKPGNYDFYLCGWQTMIRDVTRVVDRFFPGSHIYVEVFYQ